MKFGFLISARTPTLAAVLAEVAADAAEVPAVAALEAALVADVLALPACVVAVLAEPDAEVADEAAPDAEVDALVACVLAVVADEDALPACVEAVLAEAAALVAEVPAFVAEVAAAEADVDAALAEEAALVACVSEEARAVTSLMVRRRRRTVEPAPPVYRAAGRTQTDEAVQAEPPTGAVFEKRRVTTTLVAEEIVAPLAETVPRDAKAEFMPTKARTGVTAAPP